MRGDLPVCNVISLLFQSKRASISTKRKSIESEDEEDIPLSARKKIKKETPVKRKKKHQSYSDDEESEVETKKVSAFIS